jgi:CubicO group peptidase (beta-lactamase class C family)
MGGGISGDIAVPSALLDGIHKLMTKYTIRGCSVSVVKNAKIIFSEGIGLKNDHDKVDSETQFLAGSVSKPIFSIGCKILEQNKIIDIDDLIDDKLVDSFERFKNHNITIRQLLSHTAGLSISGFLGYNRKSKIPKSTDDIVNGIDTNHARVEVDYVPRINMIYSGGGTTFAQAIIEHVTKQTLPDIAKQLLFDPLNIKSTYVQPIKISPKNYACGYENNQQIDGEYHIYPEMAAAGLWSSSHDLAIIGIECIKALRNKSNIINKTSIDDMLTIIHHISRGLGIGVGFIINKNMFQHGGVDEGFTTLFQFNKKNGDGVVVMVNDHKENTFDFIDELTQLLATSYHLKLEGPGVQRKTNEHILDKYIGEYTSVDSSIKIYRKDKKIILSIQDNHSKIVDEINIFESISNKQHIFECDKYGALIKFEKNIAILFNKSDIVIYTKK